MNFGTVRINNIGAFIVVVILLVGIVIGLCVSSLTAQQRYDAFGDIVCTGITIVDDNAAELVKLGADEHGGFVYVWGHQWSG